MHSGLWEMAKNFAWLQLPGVWIAQDQEWFLANMSTCWLDHGWMQHKLHVVGWLQSKKAGSLLRPISWGFVLDVALKKGSCAKTLCQEHDGILHTKRWLYCMKTMQRAKLASYTTRCLQLVSFQLIVYVYTKLLLGAFYGFAQSK